MRDPTGAPAEREEQGCEARRTAAHHGHGTSRVPSAGSARQQLERALGAYQGTSQRLALARAVEAAAESELARKYPERALRANVEFYTALLLEALEIPRGAFTAIFACARVAGYAAHYAEQRRTGRLIRPSGLYVGPAIT